MSDDQKNIVAAILAVHSGRITPDEAAAMLGDPGKAPSLVDFQGGVIPTVMLSDADGEMMELPIIDVLDNPALQKKALKDIGIAEQAQATLFNFGNGQNKPGDNTKMRVLHDTLKQVAGARKLSESEIRPGEAGSESPTQGPRKNTTVRLTTSKFLENFGVTGDKYEVKKEHARGGMGRVLLAKDRTIGRDVALKELLPGMAGSSSIPGSIPQDASGSGGIVERFLREAKITGQLEHPNIVPVYEIGKNDDNSVYYTMRFIRGVTVADRLRDIRKDESLRADEKLAARIKLLERFIDVCHAIGYAHSKGVIHRDLKPDNIMLGDYGETLVLDWGLARVKGQEDKALRDLAKGSIRLSASLFEADSQALTIDGSIVGTPAYMPPEQARGELDQVDEQSDVYALGAVLYQILTGHAPYEGPMAALIIQQVLAGPPLRVRAREPKVPPELEALVEKAMARDKSQRINSALELASEVQAFRDGRTLGSYDYSASEMVARFLKQHRTSVGFATLCVLLMIAGAVWGLQQLAKQRDDALQARDVAEQKTNESNELLKLAQSERAAKEALEEEARKNAIAQLESRVGEAEKLLATIKGMRIEPAIEDLRWRNEDYKSYMAAENSNFIELEAFEQQDNGVLLSTLLGYITAQQSLLDLLDGPAGAKLPDALRDIDLGVERERLRELRLEAATLARMNGDFSLALLLISGAKMEQARLAEEQKLIEVARVAMLRLHERRIQEALNDVEKGLNRVDRESFDTLEAYIERLSTYREPETVQVLALELDDLRRRARNPRSTWAQPDRDLAALILRVLGNMERPHETVPLLAGLMGECRHDWLAIEAAHAIAATGSTAAFETLLPELQRRGLDFWKEIAAGFGKLPMPERVRTPRFAADFIDRSISLRAAGKYAEAIEAASNALNLNEGSSNALLQRGLARAASGNVDAAIADLIGAENVVNDAALHYEILLARGDLRDPMREAARKLADYEAAIKLQGENARGYARRAAAYGARYMLREAIADYDRALELAPEVVQTYLDYGTLLGSRAMAREAEAVLTRAVDRWPDDWRPRSARAWLRREHGLGQAMEDAKAAVELNPNDAKSWNVMSQLYFAHSNFVDGIDAANRAQEANPNEWLAIYYRGLHRHKWQEQADGQYANGTLTPGGMGGSGGTTEGPGDTAEAAFKRVRDSRLSAAAADFAEASRIEPTDFRTSYLHADTLMQLERWDDAFEVVDKALQLNPFCFMRWGGDVIPVMRHWHMALAHRDLMKRDPANDLERIHKVMMLASMAAAGRTMVFPERTVPALQQAVALMDDLMSRAGSLKPDEVPVLCYAQDRLIDALTAGGQRNFQLEAARQLELRRKLGRFLDYDFHIRAMIIYGAIAGGYRNSNLDVLAETKDGRAAMHAGLRALGQDERAAKVDENMALALADLKAAADKGMRVAGMTPGWDFGMLNQLRELPGFADVNATLRSEPVNAPGPESAYDEIMVLVSVVQYGPAWEAGMRPYDQLVSVDGKAVFSAQEFMAAWGAIPEGQEATIRLTRFSLRGAELEIRKDAEGKPLLDQQGFVQYVSEDIDIKVRRGFLGINIGRGMLPPRFPR